MSEFFGNIGVVGELDIYNVTLTAGLTYYVELEGSATGQGTLLDPFLQIFWWRPSVFPFPPIPEIRIDDDGGVGSNARFVLSAPLTGPYSISVIGAGDATGSYRLRVNVDDWRDSFEGVGAVGQVSTDGTPVQGLIDFVGDADLIEVSLIQGVQYYIDCS